MFCLSAWVVPAISAGHGSGAVRDQEKIGGCLGVPVQDFLPWAKPQCEMGIHSSVLIALFKKVVKRKDPVARKYVDRVISAPHVRSWQDTEMQGVRVHMQGNVPSAAKVESNDDMAFLQCEG